MNEKQKRDAHMLYNANYDEQLLKELEECKDLCFDYNQLKPSMQEERMQVLDKILGGYKSILAIQSPFWCDYGYNIEVGEAFYANHGCVILDAAKVTFGDFVFIGPNCGFHTAGHPIDAARRNAGIEFAHPIHVGSHVWFGAGVQVLAGVRIGSNVVIGSGSVVTKDIPDNVVAVGNPCKVLREICEEDAKKMHVYNR